MREKANRYQNGGIRSLTQVQLPKGIIKRHKYFQKDEQKSS
jgi:hypothetical protein